jgi:DNA processing protein
MAANLATAGLTVTSGLARGVDASAHRGSLDAGGGTIAVMATGIDIVYPRCNRKLHDYIAGHGLVVSEFPPGVPPRRQHFPQRNRIISGLALGTLVVEAGLRSGSLITARLAGEQGREVFAVPGSIHVPTSRGCHHLIRQGAKLVESIEDVVTEIGHFFSPAATLENSVNLPPGGLNERVYCLIDYAPVTIDQLIDRSGLTADQVCSILVNLELEGLIALGAGGYQRLPGLSPEVTGKLTHTQ